MLLIALLLAPPPQASEPTHSLTTTGVSAFDGANARVLPERIQLAAGNEAEALVHYRRSLELKPDKRQAVEVVEGLFR